MSEYKVEAYEDAPHWLKVMFEGRKVVGEIMSKPSADFWAQILNNETAYLRQQLAEAQKTIKTLKHQDKVGRKLYDLRIDDLKAEHHYRRQIQVEHAQMKAALEAIAEHAPEAAAKMAKVGLSGLKPLEELDEVAEVVQLEQLEKFFAAIKDAANMLEVQAILAEYDSERQEHPLEWLMPKDTTPNDEEIIPATLEEVAQIEAEYQAHVAKQPKLTVEEIDWFAKHYVDHDEFRLMPEEGYVDWLDNKAVRFFTSLTKGTLYELREAYNTPASHAAIAKRRDELKNLGEQS